MRFMCGNRCLEGYRFGFDETNKNDLGFCHDIDECAEKLDDCCDFAGTRGAHAPVQCILTYVNMSCTGMDKDIGERT